jgi:peptidoglycan LD-endopeptidase CwlK
MLSMPDLPILLLGSTGSYVQLLQTNLNGLGVNFNNFPIDGAFGLKTQQAVGSYQDDFKLVRDGVVGPATWKVLTDNVKAVQRLLNARGYNAGYPDGWYGQMTTNAVMRFQKDNGLYPEGVVNPRTRRKLFNPYPKDNYEYRPTSSSISSLNPIVAQKARKFLDLAKANNMDVRITAAFRSWNDSDRLYAQGRTTPGDVISNARGGESYHNWGLAFDAAPFENGVISNDIEKFKAMGKLGEQAGLEWGGRFKDLLDYPHFQYTFGLSTEDLLNGVTPPTV